MTFLFTDIESSTRLLARLGEADYAAVLRYQRDLLMQAARRHGGEVQPEAGDGSFVVFDTAASAAIAVLEFQLGVQQATWPRGERVHIRTGFHTGPVTHRREGYIGLAVHQAARISAAAHGDQVLLSAATAELIVDALPQRSWLTWLGEVELKDFERPVRIAQLVHSSLPASFPPARSLKQPGHNMPQFHRQLFGRAALLHDLTDLVVRSRLVSLAGEGGIGKSVLAWALGEALATDFRDGAWQVDLSAVEDVRDVWRSIGLAIRMRGDADATDAAVMRHLRTRQTLVLLDNCEHLLPQIADTVSALLAECPDVSIMTTTREPLGLAGEVVQRVPALSLRPEVGEEIPPAVNLFVSAAESLGTRFDTTPTSLAVIATICEMVDCVPLCIEIAASWSDIFSVRELRYELSASFEILGTRALPQPSRHRTLNDVLAWSYARLSASDQQAFRALSIFKGTFDRRAAETVLSAHQARALVHESTPHCLDALVRKSLLVRSDATAERRTFRVRPVIREFATHKLADERETDRVVREYLRWAQEVVRDLRASLNTTAEGAALGLYRDAAADMVSAVDLAFDRRDADLAVELVEGLAVLWHSVERAPDVTRRVERAVTLVGTNPSRHASLVEHLSRFLARSGDLVAAKARADEAVELFRAQGNRVGEANALHGLADIEYRSGASLSDVETPLRRSIELARTCDDESLLAFALNTLAVALQRAGRHADALGAATEANSVARHLGVRAQLRTVTTLANARIALGDNDEAEGLHRKALALAELHHLAEDAAVARANLGQLAIKRGEWAVAERLTLDAIAGLDAAGRREDSALCYCNLADAAIEAGQRSTARSWVHRAIKICLDLDFHQGSALALRNTAYALDDDYDCDAIGFLAVARRLTEPSAAIETDPEVAILRERHREIFDDCWRAGATCDPREALLRASELTMPAA